MIHIPDAYCWFYQILRIVAPSFESQTFSTVWFQYDLFLTCKFKLELTGLHCVSIKLTTVRLKIYCFKNLSTMHDLGQIQPGYFSINISTAVRADFINKPLMLHSTIVENMQYFLGVSDNNLSIILTVARWNFRIWNLSLICCGLSLAFYDLVIEYPTAICFIDNVSLVILTLIFTPTERNAYRLGSSWRREQIRR